jgi:cytochrome c-type biogenesis protein
MDTQSVTLPLAFLAGLLSFVSPCVLPLVPAYMGYLGGTVVTAGNRTGTRAATERTFLHALLFVAGFSLVFVLLGASATLLGRFLLDYSFAVQRVGGILLLVFGVRLMAAGWDRQRWIAAAILAGLLTLLLDNNLMPQRIGDSLAVVAVLLVGAGFPVPVQIGLSIAAGALNFFATYDAFVPRLVASLLVTLVAILVNRADVFYSEKRIELSPTGQAGYLRSALIGIVFAAGWTPCVGPILTGILLVASTLQTVGQGILLLTSYSLGLGIPFLLVGLAFGPLSGVLRKANRYLNLISIISGVLLALMGILIFTDSLSFLSQYSSFFELGL